MYWTKNGKYRQEVVGKEKMPNRMWGGKIDENKVERGEKRHNWFVLRWKFALRNKAFTGTAVEVSSSPVHLCTVTSPCHKSRRPPAPRTGPGTPNEMMCESHLWGQKEAEGLRISCRFWEEGRRDTSSSAEKTQTWALLSVVKDWSRYSFPLDILEGRNIYFILSNIRRQLGRQGFSIADGRSIIQRCK